MSVPWAIPKNWRWSTMGDVADIVGGGTPRSDRAEYFGGNIPWITPADLSGYTEKFISTGARSITKKGLDNSGARLMPAGTVLFSSRAPIGYVAIAANSVSTNQGFKSFTLREGLTSDFVYYYLQHAKKLAVGLASGTTFLEISGKKAAQIPIPIAPLAEQKRIVAEIEKQFTRLDAGIGALKRVQANLKRYRAAILKAACEGKLVPTEAELARGQRSGVRSQNKFETGEELLRRILAERREKWNGKGKYKEPAVPDTANLPKLPEGWVYASVEQLGIIGEQAVMTGPFGTNLGREDFKESGVPVLTISCLRDDGIHVEKADFVSADKAKELVRYQLKPGDLLFSRMASVGRAGIVGEATKGSLFNYHIMRLRLEPTVLLAKFYLAYVRGAMQVERYLREVNHGATRAGINTEQLLNMPVVLPPVSEQKRIVAEVERRLSVVEELETLVSANFQRATRLRQSILQKAFEGGLV